ncbi:unnamed protein product [Penicillium camemberti]|uniref:Str. FM013 n=1 Tax=Penicillium camemberti (strain FM 013) TaxID=1429867 RepID=A0A0G4P485_PENC3|nr:unnamed protein product [Penicillium camemberti]
MRASVRARKRLRQDDDQLDGDTTFTGIARPASGPECELGKNKPDGFHIPLSR